MIFKRFWIPIVVIVVFVITLGLAVWDNAQPSSSEQTISTCFSVKRGTLRVRTPGGTCKKHEKLVPLQTSGKGPPIPLPIFPLALSTIAGVMTVYLAISKVRTDERGTITEFLADSHSAVVGLQMAIDDALTVRPIVEAPGAVTVRQRAEAVQGVRLRQDWKRQPFYGSFHELQDTVPNLVTAIAAYSNEMQDTDLRKAMTPVKEKTRAYLETAERVPE